MRNPKHKRTFLEQSSACRMPNFKRNTSTTPHAPPQNLQLCNNRPITATIARVCQLLRDGGQIELANLPPQSTLRQQTLTALNRNRTRTQTSMADPFIPPPPLMEHLAQNTHVCDESRVPCLNWFDTSGILIKF